MAKLDTTVEVKNRSIQRTPKAFAKNSVKDQLRQLLLDNEILSWSKMHLQKFSKLMLGHKSLLSLTQAIISELAPLVNAGHGTFYIAGGAGDETVLNLIASYGFTEHEHVFKSYRLKECLIGQCAFEKKRILITHSSHDYNRMNSGLFGEVARNFIVLPIIFDGELKAVIELVSSVPFSQKHVIFMDQLMDSVGVAMSMITSNMKTEELRQEIKKSNMQLEKQTKELEEKAKLLEAKNQEIEIARRSLEEKEEHLSLISKYKSEFLESMSHELRTPLSSLLSLSKTLADNREKNLTAEQVKFARTVHSAGQDLLTLINEILELSKLEVSKMPVISELVLLSEVQGYIKETFHPVAEHKHLQFSVELDPEMPESMFTDQKHLRQILKNLLSNAFKYTDQGFVKLEIQVAKYRRDIKDAIIFRVSDTGMGIPFEKQKTIFESFRRDDEIGFGLTTSREIAHLLGGNIEVQSKPGEGSVFTLCLPLKYTGTERPVVSVPDGEGVASTALPLNADFSGRKILIVDDDVRNIFSLASVLKMRGMHVIFAENGHQGIRLLTENPETDLILMDTVMPEMDGIETIKQIRKQPQFANLPIISLTCPVTKNDREKCLETGASDYVSKPVDESHLLSVMYSWLPSKEQMN